MKKEADKIKGKLPGIKTSGMSTVMSFWDREYQNPGQNGL